MVVVENVRIDEEVDEIVRVGTVATGLMVTFVWPEVAPSDGTAAVTVTLP